jgi:hypothetical protein
MSTMRMKALKGTLKNRMGHKTVFISLRTATSGRLLWTHQQNFMYSKMWRISQLAAELKNVHLTSFLSKGKYKLREARWISLELHQPCWNVRCSPSCMVCLIYRGADKSLARPTSWCILFDGENISFDASLVIYINSTNIPPIMIINGIYENQNLVSLYLVSFLVGLRTYQHPCT